MKEKKEKSPAKFLGAIGMTKGLLGGVRDVIQNKKAATAAGQDYSFKQGMGDFAVGGLNQVLGPNRAGTPTREFQQPNMEFPGQMSAQQMEQFQKMFQTAQNMQSPAQMKGEGKDVKVKRNVIANLDITKGKKEDYEVKGTKEYNKLQKEYKGYTAQYLDNRLPKRKNKGQSII